MRSLPTTSPLLTTANWGPTPVSDQAKKRGMRLSLGRRAAQYGIKLDVKSTDSLIVVRLAEQPAVPQEPKAPTERKARKSRQTHEEVALR